MGKYSITINFFVPKKIVENLKKEKIEGNFKYDWRKEGYSHCTVKAIEICDVLPEQKIIDSWISKTQKILSKQKSFDVSLTGIENFPNVIYAKVNSSELIDLHKKLFKVLPSNRPHFENNNYTPHVTILTFKELSNEKLKSIKNLGKFKVEEIQLVFWDIENEKHEPIINHRFKLQRVQRKSL